MKRIQALEFSDEAAHVASPKMCVLISLQINAKAEVDSIYSWRSVSQCFNDADEEIPDLRLC